MDTKLTAVLRQLSSWFVYAAIALAPLAWLPVTLEQFELSKYTLLYACVLISLVCFLIRAIRLKSVVFRRTPLDVPLAVMVIGAFVASVFSADRTISFFGEYSFVQLSFFGVIVFGFLYILALQHCLTLRHIFRLVYALCGGALLAGCALLASYLPLGIIPAGIKLPAALTHTSLVLTGVFFVIMLIVGLTLLAHRRNSALSTVLGGATFVLSVVVLLVVGTKFLWIIVAASVGALLIIFLTRWREVRSWWSSLAFAVLVASLVFVFLGTPRLPGISKPNEVFLGHGTSWNMVARQMSSSFRELVVGTGLGNFVVTFSKFRSPELNATQWWNLRFYQPVSTMLELVSTGGVVLAIGWAVVILVVIGMIFWLWWERSRAAPDVDDPEENQTLLLVWGLAVSWAALTVLLFVINFGVAHWVAWWTLTAGLCAAATLLVPGQNKTTIVSLEIAPQYALAVSFSFILLFAAIVVWGVYVGRFYAAEVVYWQGLNRPTTEKIASIQKAIALNPNRTAFYLALSDAFLARAGEISRSGGDGNQVYQTLALAIESVRRAQDLSPQSVAVWEFSASLYANARTVIPDANTWVKTSLERALELEPANARLHVLLADGKSFERDYSGARLELHKALELKSDYIDAYVQLAALSEQAKDVSGAIAALEKGLPYGQRLPDYLVRLATIHLNRATKKDLAAAEDYFRQAIFLNANHSDALYGLAIILERRGELSAARQLYQKVAELNPGNEVIMRKLNGADEGP